MPAEIGDAASTQLPLEERFFERWLALFSETAHAIFAPEAAERVVGRAVQIAANMRRVMAAAGR